MKDLPFRAGSVPLLELYAQIKQLQLNTGQIHAVQVSLLYEVALASYYSISFSRPLLQGSHRPRNGPFFVTIMRCSYAVIDVLQAFAP
jgi:hypothetical protein